MLQPAKKCTCSHHSPTPRTLRSVEFNRALAKRIDKLGLSGDGTVDALLAELLDHRNGELFGPNGGVVPLDSEAPSDVDWFDRLFSEDQRRFINRYKARADEGAFKYRLQARLVDTVALMFLALEVRDCRMFGKCARVHEAA